jgi:apolipoprotein D and lipocalin family protein
MRVAFALFLTLLASTTAGDPAVAPVPHVDLDKYVGRWFEIARYPNRFQTSCAGDVIVQYTRMEDGRIRVVNRCRRADGSINEASGVARPAGSDRSGARLEVRFAPAFLSFLPAVWGDYWIIGLAADYSWAVVGEPSRKYLWVLARTPEVTSRTYEEAVDVVRAQGYDPARLVPTPQAGGGSGQAAPAP